MNKSNGLRDGDTADEPSGRIIAAEAGGAGSEKPTLRTLAALTGFAVTTVSRALANDPRIALRTREQVAGAAAQIGYVPDRAAQRLRTGKTHVISIVLDPHSEIMGFAASMIGGVAEAVRGTRYHLTLVQYQLGEDPLAPIRHIVRNRLADGIAFARTEPRDPRVAFLMDANFPFVTHGRTEFPGHAWLDYDNAEFARLAVHRLAARGRRRLCLIPPSRRYTFSRHMIAGFRQGLKETAAEGETTRVDLNGTPIALSRELRQRLEGDAPPDGIICPGEISAIAANAAVVDAGREPGRDVDLIAKQTTRVFDLHRPRIDTIYEDIENSGRQIARLLLKRIAGEPADSLQLLLPPVPEF